MPVEVEPVGTTAGHAGQSATDVSSFVLDNGNGLQATVWNYGGHLVSVKTPDANGDIGEVTLSRGGLADYDQTDRGGYMGAIVGRYANRIAGGRFQVDGVNYRLATNEDGRTHLHGGQIGFDQYVWSAEPFDEGERCGVRLSHSSPDGDEGYPGRLDVSLTYSVSTAGELAFEYRALCDRPTIVNLTNHAYWNLAGPDSGSVLGHELLIAASDYLATDAKGIPAGRPRAVDGTEFDFREARPIAESYDHCFLLTSTSEVAAVVTEALSGRRMTVTTNQPGLQLYTGQYLDPRHPGLCLESQKLPDSPNRPDFDSPVLRPGELYDHVTTHTFDTI
ncbi:MAG: aldose 1-epimerase [Acidimicrobiales bacterium]|jgi:aldose 1-epimerase